MSNHPEVDELNEHDHKKLASARAEKAINIWGKHLFPLIDSSELLIKGVRQMPNYDENISRSNYYGINGVVDVLTSLKINDLEQSNLDNYDNMIVQYLKRDPEFQKRISSYEDNEDYEIIIDYKGMKRPPTVMTNPKAEDKWETHKQQILTYSWLRSKQEDAKPIVAGIIFYLNELVPSKEDLVLIQDELENGLTDVGSEFERDVELIRNWQEDDKAPELSDEQYAQMAALARKRNAKKNKQLCDQRKLVESMMNALLTLVNYHSVADCLDFSPILPFIGTYDEECTDTMLYILSCTGDMKYMEMIEREAARFPSLPLEEYRAELLGRAGSAKDNI